MDYKIEDIAPDRKKIVIKFSPTEINTIINTNVNEFAQTNKFPGYRLGKIPPKLVESRMHDQIYAYAKDKLINLSFESIVGETNVVPIAQCKFVEKTPFARDTEFVVDVEFAIMPPFDLPNYEGLEYPEPPKLFVTKAELQQAIDAALFKQAKLVKVKDHDKPRDFDVVDIDFRAYRDKRVEHSFDAKDFRLQLDSRGALPAFEAIIKTMSVGEVRESEITFPDNFFNENIRGLTLPVKIKLNAIYEYLTPALDENFAKKYNCKTVDEFVNLFTNQILFNKVSELKSRIGSELAQKLLPLVDFPVPDDLVDLEIERELSEQINMLTKRGISPTEAEVKNFRQKYRPIATETMRVTMLLMAIAKHAGLALTESEVQNVIEATARNNAVDYNELRKRFQANGVYFLICNQLLADKGRLLLYTRANFVKPNAETVQAANQASDIHYYQPEQKNADAANTANEVEAQLGSENTEDSAKPATENTVEANAENNN